tara:strand:+ start:6341 stop:6631 length:291 start_codon:yes stop_codon:yes gene_type:complete
MIILITFLVTSVCTFGYIWLLWDKVSTGVEMAEMVADEVGDLIKPEHKVNIGLQYVKKIVGKFRNLLWIPAIFLVMVNFIVAFILGGFISLIVALF